jgi:hypothetical protein
MPEGMNVEVAHKLSEREESERHKRRWEEVVEIVEVVFLAIAAIATAWSGYQAGSGDGRQSVLYGQASRDRFQADAAATLGGQRLAADATMLTGWLQARAANNPQLEAMFVRRFSPEYRTAFAAWLKTDPFTNPAAPAGPGYMPGYRNPELEQAKQLNAQAEAAFDEGTHARETSDRYVRVTVLLALVLFLVAVGQRFKLRGVRIAVSALALGLLAYGLYTISTLPRLG